VHARLHSARGNAQGVRGLGEGQAALVDQIQHSPLVGREPYQAFLDNQPRVRIWNSDLQSLFGLGSDGRRDPS